MRRLVDALARPLAAGLLGLAGLLRFVGLTSESLWVDEAASLAFVREHGLAAIVTQVPLTEPHPPLYYALLEAWTGLAGTSPLALRLPSAVFGTATVGLVYALGDRLGGRSVAAWAAALTALAGLPVSQSQQARMYALLAFATVLSFYAFVAVIEAPTRRREAAYVGSAWLVGYAHTFGLLVLAAQAAYVAWRDRARRWWARFGLVAAGLSPWLAVLAHRLIGRSGAPERLAWIPEASLAALVKAPAGMLGWDAWMPGPVAAACGLAIAALAVYGGWEASRERDDEGVDPGRLLGLWLVLGLLVPFVVSKLWFPVYHPRYTIVAAPALFLLLAMGVAGLPDRRVGLLVGGVLLAATVVPLHGHYTADANEQWDEAAAFVDAQAEPDDVVLVGHHRPGWIETRTAFTYYFDEPPPVHGITNETTPQRLDRLVDDRDEVWLVVSHMDEPNADRIRQHLAASFDRGEHAWSGIGIEIHRYGAGANQAQPSASYRLSTGPALAR